MEGGGIGRGHKNAVQKGFRTASGVIFRTGHCVPPCGTRSAPAFLFLFKHLRGASLRVEYVLVEAVKGFLYSRERKCEVDT